MSELKIAVVIPAFKVRNHIAGVLEKIGEEVDAIFVIDDKCPEKTGKLVEEMSHDPRVKVIYNEENRGVGGAVKRGYEASLDQKADIVIKLDGDGQMDPTMIPLLIRDIKMGQADYVKGNRFYNVEKIMMMPKSRILGNAFLSFFSKISSGYWHIFDPNNGFTAISSTVLRQIPLQKVSDRYFFESDMLFRLNGVRAVVSDVPMDAFYGIEKSNLSPLKSLFEFGYKHLRNFCKRIFYSYLLREFTFASLQLIFGVLLVSFGAIYGLISWHSSQSIGSPTQPGTLILITLSLLSGLQFLLGFLAYDISNRPDKPLTPRR
jgi:glycosyltransferase involved in cell wall biosynthesis